MVAARLDRARREFPRLDDVWEQTTWRLARDPTLGIAIPDTSPALYAIKTFPWRVGHVPSLTIIYGVTDHQIQIIRLRVGDEPNEIPHEHTEA